MIFSLENKISSCTLWSFVDFFNLGGHHCSYRLGSNYVVKEQTKPFHDNILKKMVGILPNHSCPDCSFHKLFSSNSLQKGQLFHFYFERTHYSKVIYSSPFHCTRPIDRLARVNIQYSIINSSQYITFNYDDMLRTT